MKNDSLGDRMKTNYENIPKIKLMRRNPVILRLDGKNFHSFTKGFQRPFDNILIESIQETAKFLCENIQNVKFSYQQSDEISLLLTDYENINTAAWFDYEVQKMCSIAASMTTMAFNKFFAKKVIDGLYTAFKLNDTELEERLQNIYHPKIDSAMFDARCFSIPKEEVCNYFAWREQDCTRNSIQMVGQANFSHKELQNKSCDKIQDMLMLEKGINWNDFPTVQKRGSCCTKTGVHTVVDMKTGEQKERFVWEIDKEIPIFTQDRNYIERWI